MRKLVTLILAAALLVSASGCAVKPRPVSWQPSGGSRADATVEISCVYNPNIEYPSTSADHLHAMAQERCRAWGYSDAAVFGQPLERCLQHIQGAWFTVICTQAERKQLFQCVGTGTPDLK